MKKLIGTILTAIMMLSLVACAAEKTVVMTSEDAASGIAYEYQMDAKGDIVQKITQTTTMDLSLYTSDQIALIKESANEYSDTFNAITGVTYSIDTTDTELVETIIIDATNADTLEAISEAELMEIEGEAGSISLKKTTENMEAQGFTVVE